LAGAEAGSTPEPRWLGGCGHWSRSGFARQRGPGGCRRFCQGLQEQMARRCSGGRRHWHGHTGTGSGGWRPPKPMRCRACSAR
jgi:hypothetical protein